MLTLTMSEASRDLARLMEDAQREPVAIENDRLGAVLLSMNQYDELKRNVKMCELRILFAHAAAEAKAAGLTEEAIQKLLAEMIER